jgi:hypothetical protein
LMMGFFFLVLAEMSGYSLDGSISMETLAFLNGKIVLTFIINICLFFINLVIVCRFISDEIPKQKLNEEEQALYQFFSCRCGVTRLQFDEILKQGQFIELEADLEVPYVESTLYLVIQGVVQCQTSLNDKIEEGHDAFLKRSGQFFDIKLFNLFTLPVGFDANEFRAKTITKTKLFGWTVKGLINMRESHSPALLPFWEYMVLRTLSDAAVRYHLRAVDTVYDAWLVPEDPEWLKGAQSRDFKRLTQPEKGWAVASRQFCIMFHSLLQVFPPKGLRNGTPCMNLKRNPVQDGIEIMAKAKQEVVEKIAGTASSDKNYPFVSKRLSSLATDKENFVNKSVSNLTAVGGTEVTATAWQEEAPGEAADKYLNKKQTPLEE